MSTTPTSTTKPPSAFQRYVTTHLPVRRFTVEEYHKLIDAGYFAADERFELLEGWIVEKVSRNPPHDARVAHARRVLDRRLPDNWHVRVQSAITTADSEPEPDLAVVRGSELDYEQRHPVPQDIALVVEVANTTLSDDRELKGRVYARAMVPVFWIVNLKERQVEVFGSPSGASESPAFLDRKIYLPGQSIPFNVVGQAIGPVTVDELLA